MAEHTSLPLFLFFGGWGENEILFGGSENEMQREVPTEAGVVAESLPLSLLPLQQPPRYLHESPNLHKMHSEKAYI